MNKRLGLSARRPQVFDPKVYEARGRELQGQFYEIGGPVDTRRGTDPFGPMNPDDGTALRKGRTQWMFWAGVAGVAGASAGVVGYLLLQNSHPSAPPPKYIVVTDE